MLGEHDDDDAKRGPPPGGGPRHGAGGESAEGGPPPSEDVQLATRLLHDSVGGNAAAASRLLPLLYDELRRLAGRLMATERAGHSLQPTALVHEAYLRLVDSQACSWRDRAHFVSLVTRIMRQVLVDHARGKGRLKRGGDGVRVDVDADALGAAAGTLDLVILDDSLTRLETEHPRAARVVEERVFGGLTVDEIASVHDTSRSTVEADWRLARAWLSRDLRASRA